MQSRSKSQDGSCCRSPSWRSLARWLVEDHDFGNEGVDVAHMLEAATRGDRAKVLPEIAGVIRFMVVLREELEHAVVVRLVTDLQRIDEHEAAARLEHARELAKHGATDLGRQLMKHEDARHRVLAFVR